MPRNDQFTRQWHLLRQLEGSQGRSLQDLVDNVPEDYPKNASRVARLTPVLGNSTSLTAC